MQSRDEAEATAAARAAVARRDLQELRKRLSSFGQRHQISAQLQQMRLSKTELSYLLLQHYAATLEEQLASPLAYRKEIEAFIQMLDATLRGDEEAQKDAPAIYFEVEPTQPGPADFTIEGRLRIHALLDGASTRQAHPTPAEPPTEGSAAHPEVVDAKDRMMEQMRQKQEAMMEQMRQKQEAMMPQMSQK